MQLVCKTSAEVQTIICRLVHQFHSSKGTMRTSELRNKDCLRLLHLQLYANDGLYLQRSQNIKVQESRVTYLNRL